MANPQYGVTFPDELQAEFVKYLEQSGRSSRDVLREAVATFLGLEPPTVQHGGHREGSGRPAAKKRTKKSAKKT